MLTAARGDVGALCAEHPALSERQACGLASIAHYRYKTLFRFCESGGKCLRRWEILVRPEGLEPPAYWFEASRSIQLSYGRMASSYHPRERPCLSKRKSSCAFPKEPNASARCSRSRATNPP